MRYLVMRLGQTALMMGGMLLLVFILVRLTGDPARLMLPAEATTSDIAHYRHDHGLDRPVPIQLASYVGGLLQGDLGESLFFRQSVTSLLAERAVNTFELGGVAMLLVVTFGLALGVTSALYWRKWPDYVIQLGATLGQAVPVFITGVFLILIFGVTLKWLPITGVGGFDHLIMPAVTLASFSIASVVRLTRSAMIEVLGSDYLKSARAKGLPERIIIWRHAFRNALVTTITFLGLQLAVLLAGAVVTETLFAWPGLGRLIVDGILARDYPVVQGAVLLVALLYLLLNLAVDLLYQRIDPRIRLGGQ